MTSLHKALEGRLAELVGKDDVVLFPNEFTTTASTIDQLAGKKDLIIFDRECHAAIVAGLKLSEAKWLSFNHNRIDNLADKLARYKGDYEHIFVVVEAAYSISGDLAPLKEIVSLKEFCPFLLYVDESHTFGIYGEGGRGYCHAQGVSAHVDFIAASLSKATAGGGGFIATRKPYGSLLRWSDPYVFETCIAPADAAAVLASLDEMENHPELISELHEKNRLMRERLKARGFNLGKSQSPIIPIFINDARKLQSVAKDLLSEGVYTTQVGCPTVKASEGRIRQIVNVTHSPEDIFATVDALERLSHKHQLLDDATSAATGETFDFASVLDSATAQANKSGEILTIAILKIMNMDAIIRDFPLQSSELVLDRLEQLLRNTLRGDDQVGRYENQGLGIVLKGIDPSKAAGLCSRLIAKVDAYDWGRVVPGISVHTSIHIINASDQALAG